jgi:hypothetical protein
VKALAVPALAHRLIVKTAATVRDIDAASLVHELLDSVPVNAPPSEGDRPTQRASASATAE